MADIAPYTGTFYQRMSPQTQAALGELIATETILNADRSAVHRPARATISPQPSPNGSRDIIARLSSDPSVQAAHAEFHQQIIDLLDGTDLAPAQKESVIQCCDAMVQIGSLKSATLTLPKGAARSTMLATVEQLERVLQEKSRQAEGVGANALDDLLKKGPRPPKDRGDGNGNQGRDLP